MEIFPKVILSCQNSLECHDWDGPWNGLILECAQQLKGAHLR
jgi:hypothetical protein